MARFRLRVNGRLHEIDGDAADPLLSILRNDLQLSGSKFGCGEGFCGACTVLIDGTATRSCVTRLGTLENKAITTIEGVSTNGRLHPVQDAFLELEAFQCGYCTPGMVMSAIGLLTTRPRPTDEDIARLMDRNACRCGAYPRIVAAIKRASERLTAARIAADEPAP